VEATTSKALCRNYGGTMKAVILCGGLGTRLREETEFKPKPMVNIGTRPILWHIMKNYCHHGFKEFVLCLGYKGEMIKEYFYNYEVFNSNFTIEYGIDKKIEIENNHAEKGWKVTLAYTGDKTLKGARLKKIEKYIDGDTFMVTYGDGVGDIDIKALLAFHKQHGKIATVTGVNYISRFGELNIKGEDVLRFLEKQEKGAAYINGGFFVFNRKIFDYLTYDDFCDLEYGPLEKLATEGQLKVYKHKGFWSCMDTLRDVDYLNDLWNRGKAEWKVW
jgi:glucose-1-phosphate cytidylyltransferase